MVVKIKVKFGIVVASRSICATSDTSTEVVCRGRTIKASSCKLNTVGDETPSLLRRIAVFNERQLNSSCCICAEGV